jgi:hypothetical protein
MKKAVQLFFVIFSCVVSAQTCPIQNGNFKTVAICSLTVTTGPFVVLPNATFNGTVTGSDFLGNWNGYPNVSAAMAGAGANPNSLMKYVDTASMSHRIDLKLSTSAISAYYNKVQCDAMFFLKPVGTNSQVILGDGTLGSLPASGVTDTTALLRKTTAALLYKPLSYAPSFSDITSKPTTLSGYGITDAQSILVSGTSIKTINGGSVLGSGNISMVTSVGLSAPSAFNVSGSPVTSSGTLTITGAGTSSQVIDGTGALKTISTPSVYAVGTAYTLTGTSQKVDFTGGGAVDPSVTIPTAGTYAIFTNVRLGYNNLVSVGSQTATIKLRRTNNTASDLSNAITNFITPLVGLVPVTNTAGDADVPTIIYTTSTSGDVVEMWGSVTGGISGVQVQEASITAVRLY